MRLSRLLAGLCLLVLLAVAAVWGVLYSNAGNACIVRWGVAMAAQSLEADMQFGDVKGSLLETLHIDGIQGMVRRSRTGFAAGPARISLKLREAARRGIVIESLECPWIKVWGMPNPGWLADIPELPPLTCQADLPLPVGIDRIRLDRIDWTPAASGPIEIRVASFAIDPATSSAGLQPVSFHVDARLRGTTLFSAGFRGGLSRSRASLSGTITGKIAFVPFETELKISVRREGVFTEGTLAETRIDLAAFSRWLSPLWRENIPIFVNGQVSGGGAWIVQPRLGFVGRFQGRFERVTFMMTGLNLLLAELNSNWKIFDGKLHIENDNSLFVGFPATLKGTVGITAGRMPDWSLEARVADLPLAELVATLPWALRYGYGIPDLAGVASVAARFDGTAPGILVNGTARVSRRAGALATSSISVRYRHDVGQPDRWDLETSWTSESAIPKGFSGITVQKTRLGDTLKPPFDVRFEAHGAHVDKLEARLGISPRGSGALELSGHFGINRWENVVAEPGGAPVRIPQDLGLLDLLLPGM